MHFNTISQRSERVKYPKIRSVFMPRSGLVGPLPLLSILCRETLKITRARVHFGEEQIITKITYVGVALSCNAGEGATNKFHPV